MMPSIPQLLIVLVIVVLIFGAKRLRNLGSDLGSAVKGFKNAVKEENEAGETARLDDKAERVAEADPVKSDKEKI
ncbi:MAG: twin-arginine translocase TatA/TatE family subunit [Gammaproteobacteria bacterium]|nr:twin-arginine translocase TatA/TatE family subunit [Gammaproteobacteria bacterium]